MDIERDVLPHELDGRFTAGKLYGIAKRDEQILGVRMGR
jgi:hypothetical protein